MDGRILIDFSALIGRLGSAVGVVWIMFLVPVPVPVLALVLVLVLERRRDGGVRNTRRVLPVPRCDTAWFR